MIAKHLSAAKLAAGSVVYVRTFFGTYSYTPFSHQRLIRAFVFVESVACEKAARAYF